MKKVLCIGSVTADIIVTPADSIPPPGTLRAVRSTALHVGGCAANAAMALARLGVPAALCCKVGGDVLGDLVCSELERGGVEVSGVVRDPAVPTTSSVVCVSSEGERSFLYTPGSTSELRGQDVPRALIDGADIVFVAGAMLLSSLDGAPCRELLAYARQKGKLTAMDTAWDFDGVWLPKIEAALPELDLFLPSREEAQKLSGRQDPAGMADFFLEKGVRNVVIKLGRDGALFCPEHAERFILPAYRVEHVADTTGAGDSFCAGFLCGLAQGWDYRKSGAFANAVGAHCVQQVGAAAGIRPMQEILRFMEKAEERSRS